jgi:hypothetical protein
MVERCFDAVEPLGDFIEAPVPVGFQIVKSSVQVVESFVLGPLSNPDRGDGRYHDRQRDSEELLERRVHPLRILPVPGAKAPPKASIVVL